MVEGINLKLSLTKEGFNDIMEKKLVLPENAQHWIKTCFVGNISKADLDDERARETNQLDLIQNASILYHTESILEMQMGCLILCWFLDRQWSAYQGYGTFEEPNPNSMALKIGDYSSYQLGRAFMYIFAGEHIMAYSFGLFRDYELKNKGSANKHGVESAPIESILRWVEILVDFTIFGGVIFYVLTLTTLQRHNLPFCIYWLLVDMVIMFFTLPYTKLAQYIQINGEITKNIYTLYQIQKTKLKERRDNVEASDKIAWKKFFQEDELKKQEKEKAEPEESPKKKKPAMVLKNASAPPPAKKKKKKLNNYSEMINQENRDNEAADENLTSESSDSSSDDESDGEFFLMEQSRHEVVTKELDFDQNEELKFSNDVYNYTICANMTKCCSPLQQGFALKQCFIVFGI